MKNYMKKIIIAFLGLFVLLTGTSVFASNVWNGQSGDCDPAVAIGVYPNIARDGYGCWTDTSVTASAGDTINVVIHYHNNTNGTLTGASGAIVKSGSGTNYTFTGTMYSSQGGSQNMGTAHLNLTSNQTLSYSSSHWMKDANAINSDTDTQVWTNKENAQVPFGNVPAGWNDYGELLVVYKVGSSNNNNNNCSISSFTANGDSGSTTINSGDDVTLAWNSNCDHTEITPNFGTAVSGSGNTTINNVTYDRTYTITGYDQNGNQATNTKTVSIYVNNNNNNNCSISSFRVNGSTSDNIQDGDQAYLTWNTNCDYVTLSTLSGHKSASGSYNMYPSSDTTYTLRAYNNNGNLEDTDTVDVYVDDNYNNSGCTINNFTIDGYSSSRTVTSGNSANLSWSTNNCTHASISNIGTVSTNSSRTVWPTSTMTYTLSAYGNNGSTQYRTVQAIVNEVYIAPVYNCAVTTVSTNVSQTSATLNGLASNSNASTYFEYGTSYSLGMETNHRTNGGNSVFSESIVGLAPSTTYYFRLVSNCGNGISRGATGSFRTLSESAPKPIYIQGTTVVSTKSPIMLKIENQYKTIGVGDMVNYTVYYKNISKSKLTSPILQVILPTGITFTNSSVGTFSKDTNTLSVELDTLMPNDSDTIYVQGRVNSIENDNADVVTTALLVYTTQSDAQENAMAYVLNTPKTGSALGAAALFGGLLSMSLIGWMIVLLLILVAILLVRKLLPVKRV